MKKPQSKSLAAFESGKSVATYLDRLVPLGDKPANILCRMIDSTKHLLKTGGNLGLRSRRARLESEHQRRLNTGERFSLKAARPSLASSVAKQIACRSRS